MSDEKKREGSWWLVWPDFKDPYGGTVRGGEYDVINANNPDDNFIARKMAESMASFWGDHYTVEWRDK